MDNVKLENMLERHEGLKLFPYNDATGGKIELIDGNITVGIGCNLSAGISRDLAIIILRYYIVFFTKKLQTIVKKFDRLNEARQAALIDMIFNVGVTGFMKFVEMLKAIDDGDFYKAADEMLNSPWATKVGNRSNELAFMMRVGTWQNL
jgi:lysozyme